MRRSISRYKTFDQAPAQHIQANYLPLIQDDRWNITVFSHGCTCPLSTKKYSRYKSSFFLENRINLCPEYATFALTALDSGSKILARI